MLKNKIKLLIPIVLIIIIIVILITKFIKFNNSKSSIDVEKPLDNEVSLSQDRINEVVDKSYKYYLLKEGNITVLDDDVIIQDNKKYKRVLLDGINSINDIDNLINNLFVDKFVAVNRNDIFNNRNYIDKDNKLYLEENYSQCNVDYDLTKAKTTYGKFNDVIYLEFNFDDIRYLEFQLHNDNGTYKVAGSFYQCKLSRQG